MPYYEEPYRICPMCGNVLPKARKTYCNRECQMLYLEKQGEYLNKVSWSADKPDVDNFLMEKYRWDKE